MFVFLCLKQETETADGCKRGRQFTALPWQQTQRQMSLIAGLATLFPTQMFILSQKSSIYRLVFHVSTFPRFPVFALGPGAGRASLLFLRTPRQARWAPSVGAEKQIQPGKIATHQRFYGGRCLGVGGIRPRLAAPRQTALRHRSEAIHAHTRT